MFTFTVMSPAAQQANAEWFDANMPAWEDAERFGDTLLSERDVAVMFEDEPVSASDWDAFLEMTFVDFAERDLA